MFVVNCWRCHEIIIFIRFLFFFLSCLCKNNKKRFFLSNQKGLCLFLSMCRKKCLQFRLSFFSSSSSSEISKLNCLFYHFCNTILFLIFVSSFSCHSVFYFVVFCNEYSFTAQNKRITQSKLNREKREKKIMSILFNRFVMHNPCSNYTFK